MIEKSSESFFRTKSLEEYCQAKNTDKARFIHNELVYNSNAIEGIYFEEIETISDGDIKTHQLSDHANAYKYVIDNYINPLTTSEILSLHKVLMSDIFRLEKRGAAGEYRKNKVYIGPRYGLQKGGMHYKSIPKAMNVLVKDIKNLNQGSIDVEDILKIHNDFEIIHPFNDGNGRTGRLILNWLSLRYLDQFIIIDVNKKKDYYQNINNNRITYNTVHPEMRLYKDRFIKRNIDPRLEILLSCYSK